MSDIRDYAFQVIDAASAIIETRIAAALLIAGVTIEDLKAGRAKGEQRTKYQCPDCRGSGILTSRNGNIWTVDLCPCFEVVITKTLGAGATS